MLSIFSKRKKPIRETNRTLSSDIFYVTTNSSSLVPITVLFRILENIDPMLVPSETYWQSLNSSSLLSGTKFSIIAIYGEPVRTVVCSKLSARSDNMPFTVQLKLMMCLNLGRWLKLTVGRSIVWRKVSLRTHWCLMPPSGVFVHIAGRAAYAD